MRPVRRRPSSGRTDRAKVHSHPVLAQSKNRAGAYTTGNPRELKQILLLVSGQHARAGRPIVGGPLPSGRRDLDVNAEIAVVSAAAVLRRRGDDNDAVAARGGVRPCIVVVTGGYAPTEPASLRAVGLLSTRCYSRPAAPSRARA